MWGPSLVWLLLLSLLPLKVQTRVLTAQGGHRDRLSLSRTSELEPSSPGILPTASDPSAAIENQIPDQVWRASWHKDPSLKSSDLSLYGYNLQLQVPIWKRGSRGRRHANSSGARGHGHLMRVGCALGTCQVQNLSHRLYQLIGQSGREDSSPINPRSPHSYG
ncbi:protein ADM2 [Nematolebias whitei]|uniref:protein ADM2 n=1 Tax=Nematolebias whitei TaxID=451745 RepID=UPI0018982021|nr:protein ADM2 [Nematolebias whitei]